MIKKISRETVAYTSNQHCPISFIFLEHCALLWPEIQSPEKAKKTGTNGTGMKNISKKPLSLLLAFQQQNLFIINSIFIWLLDCVGGH